MREVVIRVETDPQCRHLERFLRDRRVRGRPLDGFSVAVDLDQDGCPELATLVAAVEEWRASAHAGEAVLELAGETRMLRTET